MEASPFPQTPMPQKNNGRNAKLDGIGRRIQVYRFENKIKQRAFAKKLGISSTWLSLVEHEHRAPSFEFLNRVKQYVPVTDEELMVAAESSTDNKVLAFLRSKIDD